MGNDQYDRDARCGNWRAREHQIPLLQTHGTRASGALRHRASDAPALDPATAAIARIEREEMRRALLHLRRRDRAVLALRFEQDLTFPEIGRIFGRPEATVKTWVHRALDKLQNELGGAQPSPAVEES